MKAVLVALNASYSHSSLALRYLLQYCKKQFPGLRGLEFNINQDPGLVLAELVQGRPDLVGFSCYIWNIELVLLLVSNLKKVLPQTTVVLGGPEVSFDTNYWLETYPEIDYIIAGEGEESFRLFLGAEQKARGRIPQKTCKEIPGLVYRRDGRIFENPIQPLDLEQIPPIYAGDLSALKNKIVYYETTRGCPFRCAYCLSSVLGGVRKFPEERCLEELRRLAGLGLEQIRFVDRTFNYDPLRAYDLLQFMISLETETRFQLEVSGDILTDRVLGLLTQAPENRFQFEIGVQSTNEATLEAVSRRCDLKRLQEVVRFLKTQTKVRVLLDLIAGLPYEGFWRFGESFDYVYNLKPDRIHLGFLKLLRGSRLRQEAESFGCIYAKQAPYEVLSTADLSFAEIRRLKIIEDLTSKYANRRFARSLEYLLRGGQSPFHFFNLFGEKWEAAGYHWYNHSLNRLYEILADFFSEENPDLQSWLKFDYRANEPRRGLPQWMGPASHRRAENDLIRSGQVFRFVPELESLGPREIGRRIFVEEFSWRKGKETILFYFPPGRKTALTFPLP